MLSESILRSFETFLWLLQEKATFPLRTFEERLKSDFFLISLTDIAAHHQYDRSSRAFWTDDSMHNTAPNFSSQNISNEGKICPRVVRWSKSDGSIYFLALIIDETKNVTEKRIVSWNTLTSDVSLKGWYLNFVSQALIYYPTKLIKMSDLIKPNLNVQIRRRVKRYEYYNDSESDTSKEKWNVG